MSSKLILEESRLEYQRAVGHNEHSEQSCAWLLGFTGVIFAAILSFVAVQSSGKLSPFDFQLIQESLIALGLSAGLAALPLASGYQAEPSPTTTLLGNPGLGVQAAETVAALEYQVSLLFGKLTWILDDLFLDFSIVALADGLVFAIITQFDPPPPTVVGIPTTILIGLLVFAATSSFFTPRLARFFRERGKLARSLKDVKLLQVATLVNVAKESPRAKNARIKIDDC